MGERRGERREERGREGGGGREKRGCEGGREGGREREIMLKSLVYYVRVGSSSQSLVEPAAVDI